MPFHPNINDTLTIDGVHHRIAAHPAAPGMPYGQTGRRATVYQVIAPDNNRYALKVFTAAFRSPRVVEGAARLHPFTRLPGLQACARTALTAPQHQVLLQQHPDLAYAILMPWVSGETWQEILLTEEPLSGLQSCALAQAFVRILATLEQQGVAHCDLSGPNVLITHNPLTVALVDLEDLYGPDLAQPDKLPGGSPGYAHKTAPTGLWSADADRFAGAVLLAEMLGWCDDRVCQAAFGETYFDPDEMQQESERKRVLLDVLHTRWGEDVAALFDRVWHAETLNACPALMEWAATLGVAVVPSAQIGTQTSAAEQPAHSIPPEYAPQLCQSGVEAMLAQADTCLACNDIDGAMQAAESAYHQSPDMAALVYIRALLRRGEQKEASGDVTGALNDYRAAHQMASPGDLRDELTMIMNDLTGKIAPVQQNTTEIPTDKSNIKFDDFVHVHVDASSTQREDLSHRQHLLILTLIVLFFMVLGGSWWIAAQ